MLIDIRMQENHISARAGGAAKSEGRGQYSDQKKGVARAPYSARAGCTSEKGCVTLLRLLWFL